MHMNLINTRYLFYKGELYQLLLFLDNALGFLKVGDTWNSILVAHINLGISEAVFAKTEKFCNWPYPVIYDQ